MADRLNNTGSPAEGIMLFTGNANPRLASDVAKCLSIPLGRANVGAVFRRRGHHRNT